MSTSTTKKSVFDTLNGINCNNHVESKNGLSYLSWAWAWAEVKKKYPNASYIVHRTENGLPYIVDPSAGIMVFTSVTIEEQTLDMWLPVMDAQNRAMKDKPCSYEVYNKRTAQMEKKTVEQATAFDINKAIMRCLVKNLAMFGLGLYIYAGEDLPEQVQDDMVEEALRNIGVAKSLEDLTAIWGSADSATRERIKSAVSSKRKELGI